jgi:predicted nucleic acid-binding protein
MSAEVVYLDSSAAVKVLMREQFSLELRAWLSEHPRRTSASLLRVELIRAIRRAGAPALVAEARGLLTRIDLVALDDSHLDSAADLSPVGLRSLDAIHLAVAAGLGSDLETVVTYDRLMVRAAQSLGLPVVSPGV